MHRPEDFAVGVDGLRIIVAEPVATSAALNCNAQMKNPNAPTTPIPEGISGLGKSLQRFSDWFFTALPLCYSR